MRTSLASRTPSSTAGCCACSRPAGTASRSIFSRPRRSAFRTAGRGTTASRTTWPRRGGPPRSKPRRRHLLIHHNTTGSRRGFPGPQRGSSRGAFVQRQPDRKRCSHLLCQFGPAFSPGVSEDRLPIVFVRATTTSRSFSQRRTRLKVSDDTSADLLSHFADATPSALSPRLHPPEGPATRSSRPFR